MGTRLTSQEYMIRLYQVSKRFINNVVALRQLTANIEQGEWVFLSGPSGAGKTTLMNIIFGMMRPTEGQVEVGGVDLTRASQTQLRLLRRNVGFVFQNARLLEHATVFENVALPLQIRGFSDDMMQKLVLGTLEQLGLDGFADAPAKILSGGEKQKVALARAIVTKPPLILADEPTGNLDAQSGQLIMDLFRKIHHQGTTIVLATHDENWLKKYAKRVISLNRGQLERDSQHGLRI